jgi:hypothetical protein
VVPPRLPREAEYGAEERRFSSHILAS